MVTSLDDIVMRGMDIAVSSTALVVLSPVYAGIAAAISIVEIKFFNSCSVFLFLNLTG